MEAVRSASGAFSAPLILAVCPPAPEHAAAFEAPCASCCERHARPRLGPLILPGEVAALYPVAEIHDPHGDELGHVPYTPVFFAALATAIARRIHAIARRRSK